MDISKFHEIYRIESTRLKNWDYSRPAWYFITVCTLDKKWFFGRVEQDEMKLSRIGEIAKNCWEEIPKHFDNVKLRKFVVMPNHVHGVVDIVEGDTKHVVNQKSHVETLYTTSLRPKLTKRQFNNEINKKFYSLISPKPNANIPTIIRSFKSAVSNLCHKHNLNFSWQPRFYDHVIRDEYSLYFIEEYIRNNPINWKKDPLFIDVKNIDWSKEK